MIKTYVLNVIIFATLLLAGYGFAVYFDHAPPPVSKPAALTPGALAPDFSFTALDKQSRRFSDFKGKTVIVNFWASWCAPCVKEFPALLRFARAHDDVVLIALSSDMDDASLAAFLQKQRDLWKRPNILIGRDADSSITQNLFQTFQLPETYVIGPDMRVKGKLIGGDWTPGTLETLTGSMRRRVKNQR